MTVPEILLTELPLVEGDVTPAADEEPLQEDNEKAIEMVATKPKIFLNTL